MGSHLNEEQRTHLKDNGSPSEEENEAYSHSIDGIFAVQSKIIKNGNDSMSPPDSRIASCSYETVSSHYETNDKEWETDKTVHKDGPRVLKDVGFIDDDVEPILEGSELYNYLQINTDIEIDTYQPSQKNVCGSTLAINSIFHNERPKEVLTLINLILQSQLLLDEDASYLFNKSSHLEVEKKQIFTKTAAVIVVLGSLFLYFFDFLEHIFSKVFIVPLMITLIGVFSPILVTKLKCIFYSKRIESLFKKLRRTHYIIRKLFQLVQEEQCCMMKKEKLNELRHGRNLDFRDNFKPKQLEINMLCSKINENLKFLITAYRQVINILVEDRKGVMHHIAFCSDNQLGINNDLLDGNTTLSSVEHLLNIYVLLQSECLRTVGICFCDQTTNNTADIFKSIGLLSLECSKVLKLLENEYGRYLKPISKHKTLKCFDYRIKESYVLVHGMSSFLNGLMIDVRKLEDYIELNQENPFVEISQYLSENISFISEDLICFSENVKSISEHLLKTSSKNKISPTKPTCPTCLLSDGDNLHEKPIETNMTVGNSEFSIQGEDEVLIGFSDDQNLNDTVDQSDEYYNDILGPKPPKTLLTELKSALILKREEFEQRELNALKTPSDIKHYQECSMEVDSMKPLTSKPPKKSDTLPFWEKSDINTSQSLMSSAISQSPLACSKLGDIEYFEDSD